jgi:hypothetical protein
MALSTTTNTEERALSLLGDGVDPETVASALGVTPARISQLLADEEFAGKVATLRYENLAAHNKRDGELNNLEDELIRKLKKSLALIMRPMDMIKALQVVNNAKRRGQSAPNQVVNQQSIVSLTLPTQIVQKFTTNVHNQVVVAGGQSLETMQSGTLLKKLESNTEKNVSEERTN